MKRLFNNTTFSLVDYLVLVGLNLATTPILIKYFGIEGYGAFIFLNIFSIYGALAVFDLGMEGSLMNYVARFQATGDREKTGAALTVSLLYYGTIGLVLGGLLYLGTNLLASRLLNGDQPLDPEMINNAIGLVAINAFVQFLVIPLTATIQGMRRYGISKGVNTGANIVRYLLLVGVAVGYQRIDAGFMVVLAVSVLRLIGLTYFLLFRTPEFSGWRPRLDLAIFKQLFSYSSWLFITRIIGLIHNQSAKVFIWYFLSVTSMSVYDIVARPAMLLRTVFGVLVSALIPEVARLHQQGDLKGITRIYVSLVRYAYMFLLPLLALLTVYVDELIYVWVGEPFTSQAYLALILLAGFLVFPISAVANTMVVGLERVRQTIWIPIIGTGLNVGLSLYLVGKLGLAGLLVGTLGSQLFVVYPYARFMSRFLGQKIPSMFAPLLSIFALAGIALLLNGAVKLLLPGQIMVHLLIAIAILSLNYWLAFRRLLTGEERQFLLERMGAVKNRLTRRH